MTENDKDPRASRTARLRSFLHIRGRVKKTRAENLDLKEPEEPPANRPPPMLQISPEHISEAFGREHPSTLDSMDSLAVMLQGQGKYKEAEEMHRQTLELREKVLGQEHPSTLGSMNDLALVLYSQGKYEEAEGMHRQTLELREKVLGREHPSTLDSMNNLAEVLRSEVKYREAEGMHQQTLELKEKVLGREHPATLDSMNNLAMVLDSQGRYEEAEGMHRQTLELTEKVLGREHPSTLDSMNNLAVVLQRQGKYEEAEEMYRQTLELREKVLGQEHPSTLGSMNNLAAVLGSQGKYEGAERIYLQTLELKEKVFGREHPSTLGSMNNLATIISLKTVSNPEESFGGDELRSTGDTELCDACQNITLENLGCFKDSSKVLLGSDGTDTFDGSTGYEYPHTVGDLDEASKRCGLCRLVRHIIYRGGDLETILTRDKTSRIKLAYYQPKYLGVLKNYPSRACFRVYLSKPFIDGTRRGNYALLFLRVYTKPEDEKKFTHLGFGRQVVPSDSEVAFQRVLSNLTDCIKNHPACARTIDGSICDETTTLPSRLIDLGTKPEDLPLLADTAGNKGKYVALSYSWGKVPESLKLETSTIDNFKKGLPLDNIPKTIKHAMTITKRLGFRSFWVDRLCIIQDNRVDWQTEAQKMGRIYEGAVCTIAAVGAKDSGEGCFLPHKEENAVTLPVETGTLFVSYPTAPLDGQTGESEQSAWEMEDSAWSTRAWVFQERLFSRRMVLYGKGQIFWGCRMHLDSETRFGHDAGYTYKSSRYQYCRDFKKDINKHICSSTLNIIGSHPNFNLIGSPSYAYSRYYWADIVAQYSQMELTREGDRLPAIDGLAQVVQQQTKLEVCAGMWLGSLPQSLFWWPFWWDESEMETNRRQFPLLAGAKSSRPVRLSKFEAPTWSWLAAGTPVSFYPFFRATVLGIEKPKFLHDNTTPSNSSQPTPKLEIWAHTITANRTREQCVPTINKSPTERWNEVPATNFIGIRDRWEAEGMYGLIHHEDSEKYNGLVLFDDPESAPLSFDCAIVGAGPGILEDNDRLTIYFLMIQPTANPGQYRRLGIGFRTLAKDSDYLQRIPPKQCIILI